MASARALALAADLGAPRLNCLVGRRLPDVSDDVQLGTAAENLAYAAEQARAAGVAVGVEPLNPFDAPGFLLPTTDAALALLARADHRNLSLQYDVYHAQRAEGNLVATIERVAAAASSATSSSPTAPPATNPAPARSTSSSCSPRSTGSATAAGSVSSTCPKAARKGRWAGCGSGGIGGRDYAGARSAAPMRARAPGASRCRQPFALAQRGVDQEGKDDDRDRPRQDLRGVEGGEAAEEELAEAAGVDPGGDGGEADRGHERRRSPARMTGSASGQRTLRKTWPGVMPSPRAASKVAASTPWRPATRFRTR
jgi:hypothetical protein